MKAVFFVKNGGLYPLSEKDEEDFSAFHSGDVLYITSTKVRNPRFHSMAFATMKNIFSCQNQFEDWESFYEALKKEIGAFRMIRGIRGETIIKTKSFAWGEMDETEFRGWFNKILTVGSALLGCTRDDLSRNSG